MLSEMKKRGLDIPLVCDAPFFDPKTGDVATCKRCMHCKNGAARLKAERVRWSLRYGPPGCGVFATYTHGDWSLPMAHGATPTLSSEVAAKLIYNLNEIHRRNWGADRPELFRVKLHKKTGKPVFKKNGQPVLLHSLCYFLGAEYGSKNRRPHYHLILINWPQCERTAKTQPGHTIPAYPSTCGCRSCAGLREAWENQGLPELQLFKEASPESAGYVSGYATKGSVHDAAILQTSATREFSRESRNLGEPWIGAFIDYLETQGTIVRNEAGEAVAFHRHNSEHPETLPTGIASNGKHVSMGPKLVSGFHRAIKASPVAVEHVKQTKLAEYRSLVSDVIEIGERNGLEPFEALTTASLSKRIIRQARQRARTTNQAIDTPPVDEGV